MKLAGKTVLIAGAGPGIGRATALLFAREGANLILVSRRQEILDQTLQEISKISKTQTLAICADLAKQKDCAAMAEKIFRKFKTLDVLHCNMGSFSMAPAKELSEEAWDSMLDTNLKSVFLTTQALIPHFISQEKGSIILTAAIFGNFLNTKNMAHYNASKAGVVSLAKSLALELAGHNIRVNCICPGQISHHGSADLKVNPKLQRPGAPEDVAHAALYFAGDESSWVSGSTLVIDGGASAGVKL